MPALAQAELPLNATDLPALIILGRDHTNKAHAAWFDATEADAATSAATLMAMMVLPITADIGALAARLPHGRIFGGTGKAFVPFVKQATYDELIAHVPMAQQVRPLRLVRAEAGGGEKSSEPSPAPASADKEPAMSLPADWNTIVPGSVVLATVGRDDGWWEAVVQDRKPGNMWTLRWRDFPTEPAFTRQSSSLALLHTSRKPTD